MTGHVAAFSVRAEMAGQRWDAAVESALRLATLDLRRKGQAWVKRAREESLSMMVESKRDGALCMRFVCDLITTANQRAAITLGH